MTALVIPTRRRYPRDMRSISSPFSRLAQLVLPEQTSSRLPRLFGLEQRTAQRWMSGEMLPIEGAVEQLERQQGLLAAENPEQALDQLIERWRAAGLADEVIGSVLSVAYEKLLARRIR